MISKDILFLSEKFTEFKASHMTISIFAIIVYFAFKDMQMYCLDLELTQGYAEESN